jgi:hypothetical protein
MRRAFILVSSITLLSLTLPWVVESATAKDAKPSDVTWKDMNYAQRKDFMKKAVMPKMKPIFQAFDAKKFHDFTCETCHGNEPIKRKYKMPSPDIHPLPNTPEGFQAKLKVEPTWPKWTEFMAKQVEPAMGTLLEVPVFDPKKPSKDAFSCGACHKLEP